MAGAVLFKALAEIRTPVSVELEVLVADPEMSILIACVVLGGGSVEAVSVDDVVTASVSCLLSRAMSDATATTSKAIYRARRSRGIRRMMKYQAMSGTNKSACSNVGSL